MNRLMTAPENRNQARAAGVRWDLTDLYRAVDDPRIDEDLAAARTAASDFAARHRGRIATSEISAEDLAEALKAYEEILERGQRPGFYASLLFAADTQNEAAQTLEQRARESWTEIHNQLVFFDLEIQAIPEETFERIAGREDLAPYRHYLIQVRRFRPHTLSEPEEQILDRKQLTSRTAFTQLYDELTGSFRFEIEIDGVRKLVTDGELMSLLHRPERELRQRALDTLLETYRAHSLILTSIFNNLLLDHRLDADLRRFASLIGPRHLENDIEPQTVEAMMEATERHYPVVQDYLRLKARLLGLPEMTVADVYAPLSSESEEIPFEAAKQLVIESFAGFSDTFARFAQQFFERSWIDAEIRPGKRHGAFCASHSPRHHPYVLASYAGTSNDVSTIAHELGHGVHALLARGQSLLVYDAPLVLAEIASIFGEMLLTEHRLRRATPQGRARILCDTLDEIYGTIFRQDALTRFELAAHASRRQRRLSTDDLGGLWIHAQQRLFGAAVATSDLYRYGWSYIPHFVHSPFYCYSYSFGNLLVLALFERYRQEGSAFVSRYLGLLEQGGGDRPSRLLAAVGADISRPEFWETGLRVVSRLVEELRATATEAPWAG
jgi:oligoendopeptidase F